MDYQSFIQKIYRGVSDFMGEDVKVTLQEVRKNNGIRLQGIMIMPKKSNVAPTIYLESFYDEYKEGKPIGNIILDIIQIYENHQLQEQINIDFFDDFEKAKSRIFFKIINYEKNKELLEQVPHIKTMDLAIVFYCACDSDVWGMGTILIRNDYLQPWGISSSQLFEAARKNTQDVQGYEVKSLSDVIRELIEKHATEDTKDVVEAMTASFDESNCTMPMYVLTSRTKCFGAVCMLYEGLLNQLASVQNSNFFILPCSIHEVILIPDRGQTNAETLLEMVVEINQTQLAAEEILSDAVYYFDRQSDELKKIA